MKKTVKGQKEERILWVDGVKGLAALLIFTHHFMVAFFPATFFGKSATQHSSFDLFFSQNPLGFIINGNFWVHIFCILSAYIITCKSLDKIDKESMSKAFFKRYFYFSCTILSIGLVVYVLLKFKFTPFNSASLITGSSWLKGYYQEPFGFKDLILSSFMYSLIKYDVIISGAFWMLTYIFIGTYLTYILNIIFSNKKKWFIIFILFPIFITFKNYSYYACFIVGFLICYINKKFNIKDNKITLIVSFAFILLGIFLGGYPSGVEPTNIYKYLRFSGYFMPHLWGGTLTILGISMNKYAIKFFSRESFTNLSKFSYAVYLLHIPIIFFVSSLIFNLMTSHFEYLFSAYIVYFASLTILVDLAKLFSKYIEKTIVILIDKIYNFFLVKS